jgi:D-alanyl-D-alanine carboxypeptidase
MDRCRVGGKWTDHVATTSSGLFRKKPSFLVVLLVLLSFLALLPALSCGNDGQGDEREGDQVVSGFTDEMVRRLDEATAKRMQEDNLPSVVVGVWVPGEGRYVVVKGKANLKTGEKRDLGDPFRIGSITKTFVATAVLQLVEVGKLSKTDKLSEWYPDFPNAEKITIDDLLRMQSGIVDPPWEDLIGGLTSPQDAIEASANLGGASLPPGQRTEYRNINYVILGEIVGKVTGKDTGDQIARSILQPLGMNDTVYPTDSTLPGDLRGYTLDPSTAELKDVTSFDPSAEGGSGAMISDASDLKIWAEAVCTGELLNDQMQKARLRTQRLLGQPNFVGYGEGIMQAGEFCGHSGSQPGFSSQMWYLPERDATIIVNVNREEEDITLSDALASAILEIVFPKYVEW